MTEFDFQQAGKKVLHIERDGLAELEQYINDDFTLACEKIFHCQGRVIVMGMGKSGHIGHKIARLLPAPAHLLFLFILVKLVMAI